MNLMKYVIGICFCLMNKTFCIQYIACKLSGKHALDWIHYLKSIATSVLQFGDTFAHLFVYLLGCLLLWLVYFAARLLRCSDHTAPCWEYATSSCRIPLQCICQRQKCAWRLLVHVWINTSTTYTSCPVQIKLEDVLMNKSAIVSSNPVFFLMFKSTLVMYLRWIDRLVPTYCSNNNEKHAKSRFSVHQTFLKWGFMLPSAHNLCLLQNIPPRCASQTVQSAEESVFAERRYSASVINVNSPHARVQIKNNAALQNVLKKKNLSGYH